MTDEEKSFGEVLEKNYSPETPDEEKNSIQSMIRRLKRIFNWNLMEDDSLFSKERGPEIVRDLMTQYNNWKSLACTSNNLTEFVGLQHLVIYTIAKLCFSYWIRDPEIVSEVLRQVYLCDGHFSSMFTHVINQPLTHQAAMQKEYLSMIYFLTHAHNAKLEFSGLRFVDVILKVPLRVPPVIFAAIYNKPELLLLLLRHGPIVDRRLAGIRSDDWDLYMLLRYLIRTLWTSFGAEIENSTWVTSIISNSLNDVRLCLNFLLRGIRQIPFGELNFFLMKFESNGLAVTVDSYDFIRSVSELEIVPRLMSRYFEPSELQHLCRLTIRQALNLNWNLPFGVFSLPLPDSLQIYVGLLAD